MRDNVDDAAKVRRSGGFARGDCVRIVSGKLRGLTGVITRLSGRFDLVIAIDDWPSGVYVVIVGEATRSLERETRDT